MRSMLLITKVVSIGAIGFTVSCGKLGEGSKSITNSETNNANTGVIVFFKGNEKGSCIINPAAERVNMLLEDGYFDSVEFSDKVYYEPGSEHDKPVYCAINPPEWAANMLVNEQGYKQAPRRNDRQGYKPAPSDKPDSFLLECKSKFKTLRSNPNSKEFLIDGKSYKSLEDAAADNDCSTACRYRHSSNLQVRVCGTSVLDVSGFTTDADTCHKEIFTAPKVGTRKTLDDVVSDFPCAK